MILVLIRCFQAGCFYLLYRARTRLRSKDVSVALGFLYDAVDRRSVCHFIAILPRRVGFDVCLLS